MKIPAGRSYDYAVWRTCERFAITPPGIKKSWEENVQWAQALMLAYNQIRQYEDIEKDTEFFNRLIQCLYPKK